MFQADSASANECQPNGQRSNLEIGRCQFFVYPLVPVVCSTPHVGPAPCSKKLPVCTPKPNLPCATCMRTPSQNSGRRFLPTLLFAPPPPLPQPPKPLPPTHEPPPHFLCAAPAGPGGQLKEVDLVQVLLIRSEARGAQNLEATRLSKWSRGQLLLSFSPGKKPKTYGIWVEKTTPWTTLVSLCPSIGQYRFFPLHQFAVLRQL